MSDWQKLEPLADDHIHHSGCLNCPGTTKTLKMNRRVGVGFGFAGITKDGELMWSEPIDSVWAHFPTMMTFENMAREDPNHDWRAIMDGPLHGETYQRHDKNKWVLVKSNIGFA